MLDLAAELDDPAPALRKVEALERDRTVLLQEVAPIEEENTAALALARVTQADLRRALQSAAAEVAALDRERLKDLLFQLVERLTLDPDTMECVIHYRIGIQDRKRVASPTGLLGPSLGLAPAGPPSLSLRRSPSLPAMGSNPTGSHPVAGAMKKGHAPRHGPS